MAAQKRYTLAEEERIVKLRIQRYREELKALEGGVPLPADDPNIRLSPTRAGYLVEDGFPNEVWKLRWKSVWVRQLATIAALGGQVHIRYERYGLHEFLYAQTISDGEVEAYVFDAWTRNPAKVEPAPSSDRPPPIAEGRHVRLAGVSSLKQPIVHVLKSATLDEVGGIQLSRTGFYQINELARNATAAAVAFQVRDNGLVVVQLATQSGKERATYTVDALHFNELAARKGEPSLLSVWKP